MSRPQGGYKGYGWDQGAPDDPTTGVKFDADGRRIKEVTVAPLDYVALQATYGIVPSELQAVQDDVRANAKDPKRWINYGHVLYSRSKARWNLPMHILAEEAYEKALELEWDNFKTTKDKVHMMNLAFIHHQLATLMQERNELEKANVHWEKSAGALGTATGTAPPANTESPPAIEEAEKKA